MNLADLFRANLSRIPDKTALVLGERSLKFGQLAQPAGRLAGAMAALGLERPAAVGLYLRDGFEFLEAYVAATLLGLPVVPINFRYGRRELAHVVANSGVRLLLQ